MINPFAPERPSRRTGRVGGRVFRSRRRPFVRLSRAQLEQVVDGLEAQRDRALGEARATRDWVAAWLSGRADGYRADAAHLEHPPVKGTPRTPGLSAQVRRVVADELHQLALDLDRGPGL